VMFVAFGVMALALAAIGLYGVVSHGVAQRTQEIGIRVALGANPLGIGGMVVREALLLVAIGIAIGTAAALGTGRLIASLLKGVPPNDPLTFLGVIAVLCGAAMAAAWLPAYRASRVNPIVALRSE
jgi:ABC-type antimicrobial peptide transport system permease subunit